MNATNDHIELCVFSPDRQFFMFYNENISNDESEAIANEFVKMLMKKSNKQFGMMVSKPGDMEFDITMLSHKIDNAWVDRGRIMVSIKLLETYYGGQAKELLDSGFMFRGYIDMVSRTVNITSADAYLPWAAYEVEKVFEAFFGSVPASVENIRSKMALRSRNEYLYTNSFAAYNDRNKWVLH